MEKGDRVMVTGGAWAGNSGEYMGMENTPIGTLARVQLDNDASTLVPLYQVRLLKEKKMSQTNKTPSVGRIVHYVSYGSPGGEFTSECRAAIVTMVHTNSNVDLCVVNPTGLFFNTSVKQDPEEMRPGTWHWPEIIPEL